MKRRATTVLAAMVMAAGLVSGCGTDTVAVPDVVGLRLDDAKDKLRAAGFERLDAEDVVGDTDPFRDSTWAVLEQRPAAGEQVDPEAVIRLGSGPLDKAATKERLAEDSPAMGLILAAEQKAAAEAVEAQARKQR